MEKKTEKEIKQEVERLLEEIALLKEEAREQGLAFSSLSEEELVQMVRGESPKSPRIVGQAWTGSRTPGISARYSVYIHNPDPTRHSPLFMTIFFGLANLCADICQGWSGRDKRWPELSSERFSLAAGATTNITFRYTTPTGVPLTTYLGNSVLWEGRRHHQGVYFDRGLFDITLA
jgi:hypothetical protein